LLDVGHPRRSVVVGHCQQERLVDVRPGIERRLVDERFRVD